MLFNNCLMSSFIAIPRGIYLSAVERSISRPAFKKITSHYPQASYPQSRMAALNYCLSACCHEILLLLSCLLSTPITYFAILDKWCFFLLHHSTFVLKFCSLMVLGECLFCCIVDSCIYFYILNLILWEYHTIFLCHHLERKLCILQRSLTSWYSPKNLNIGLTFWG